jgi:hypothetical protein
MTARNNGGTHTTEDDAAVFVFPEGHRVRVWTGGVKMPSLLKILEDMPSVGEYAEDIHSVLFEKCGSICIFEHKVPDYLSFPWMFGATFQRVMSDHYKWMPPYNPAAGEVVAINSPSSPEMQKAFECFDTNRSITPASGGGERKKYMGRLYKVRTGTRGGKYIIVAGTKKYI